MWTWMLWNLLLAVIPVVLAYVFVGATRGRWCATRLAMVLALAAAWLAFLPNTCYLLTEWRHLLFSPRWTSLRETGGWDREAMFRVALLALYFAAYSGAGVLTFVLAVRPVEQWLRNRGGPWLLYAPPGFFLVSLGVYLGLIVRLNSWDLLLQPGRVFGSAVTALMHPLLAATIVAFGAILWALYEAVDLWLDGILDRLRAWGVLRPTCAG
jgi:uncharacterized membrane protein